MKTICLLAVILISVVPFCRSEDADDKGQSYPSQPAATVKTNSPDTKTVSELRKHPLVMRGIITGGSDGKYIVDADEADEEIMRLRDADGSLTGQYGFSVPYDDHMVLHGRGGLCLLATSHGYKMGQKISFSVFRAGSEWVEGKRYTRYSDDPDLAYKIKQGSGT